MLRDLGFRMQSVDPIRSRACLVVVPEVCVDGRLSAGPLMTMIDVLAGSLVGRVLLPDWMATSQLSLHLDDPPAMGDVTADAVVVRNGRTTVVVDVALHQGGPDGAVGRRFGEAMLTFVRLPRRDSNLDMSQFEQVFGEWSTFAVDGSGLERPYLSSLGARAGDSVSGVLRVEVTDYVRNSFGAVNGGVVAAVAAAAAEDAAGAVLGARTAAADVQVHYLTQGRVGPVVTSSRVVRSGPGGVLVRVEVADAGLDDAGDGHAATPDRGRRLMVVAHVLCVPGDHS